PPGLEKAGRFRFQDLGFFRGFRGFFCTAARVFPEEAGMASIKLPDGSVKELPDGITVLGLAESIGKRLAQAAIVGKVDGKLVDLATPLTGSHEVSIITERDSEGLYVMRHSTAHVMAQALRH